MTFPDNFFWSCSTASYQNEGSALRDGGGASVWDMFCRTPGRIFDNQSGEIACDHYRRWREDVALMAEMGLTAYRFSVSWPRVLPEGTGRVNPAGLDFYDRLVDALLEHKITPLITLFHWDYPYELFCRGAWLNRESADWFADYAAFMTDRLSDRVKHWTLFNEPANFLGNQGCGFHAPGFTLGHAEIVRMCHHLLLGYGRAVQVMRRCAKQPLEICWGAHGMSVGVPATDSPEDIEAARAWNFAVPATPGKEITHAGSWWHDPIFRGDYPAEGLALHEQYLPKNAREDMAVIFQPPDFCGINIYMGHRIRRGEDGAPARVSTPPGATLNILNWPILPEAMYWGPRFFYERYGKPIYLLETGAPGADLVSRDGKVHDPQRIDLLRRYLGELGRAIHDGVDVRACSVWTLMDNFEWNAGYAPRFGLVHVDFTTQKRTPKDSFYWYREVIASNGANLEEDLQPASKS